MLYPTAEALCVRELRDIVELTEIIHVSRSDIGLGRAVGPLVYRTLDLLQPSVTSRRTLSERALAARRANDHFETAESVYGSNQDKRLLRCVCAGRYSIKLPA